MSPKFIKSKLIIKSIYEESEKKFGCKNYQFIAERLEEELINGIEFKRGKGKENKTKEKLRNLEILKEAINGKPYSRIKGHYNLTSNAAVSIIVKRTAESLDTEIKNELKCLSPKRVINIFAAHLLDLIIIKKDLLNKELKNLTGHDFEPEDLL